MNTVIQRIFRLLESRRLLLLPALISLALPLAGQSGFKIDQPPAWDETLASREEIVTVINKWGNQLTTKDGHVLWQPIKKAVLLDPWLHERFDELNRDDPDFETFCERVGQYAWEELAHLQKIDAFSEEPGRMPWGKRNLFFPVYKRLMPSEMEWLSPSAGGKPAGACESLSYLTTGLFRLKGVDPDNVIHLRLKDHTLAVIKHENRLYGSNNRAVGPFNERMYSWHGALSCRGVFGETFSNMKRFRLGEDFFRDAEQSPCTLKELLEKEGIISAQSALPSDSAALLVRYAAQLKDVPDLTPYFEASLQGPLAKKLSRTFQREEEISLWIAENIATGSLYSGKEERILTADQVIVYQTGTEFDQYLLRETLKYHMNH